MQVMNEPSRSLKEYRLLTKLTTKDTVMSNTHLKTPLCKLPNRKGFIELNVPFVSAAMQAVSGTKLAEALAQFGGISVIPCSIPIEEQADIVMQVKRFKAGFQEKVVTLSPDDKIEKAVKFMKDKQYSKFPVTDNGRMDGKLLGMLSDKYFDPKRHSKELVKEFMTKDILISKEGITLKQANEQLIKNGKDILFIVDKDLKLRFVCFKKDMTKHLDFPDELTDERKRYMVGAAVSTHLRDQARVDALIAAEVDVIFLDSSDGYTEFQAEMYKYIRSKTKSIPVVGGNIITKDGFEYLAKAGFDAIKVGMGIGSGCTTQEQKGTGRGQATALLEVVRARDAHFKKTGVYIPVISDGSIANPGQIVIALSCGADSVMMGRFFAQFTESAAGFRNHPTLGPLKEYWMEASGRARNYGRYDTTSDLFFEEGIEGFVPHLGSIYTNLQPTINKIRSALSNAGSRSIEELHRNAVLELQSVASLQDAGVHDVIMK